MNSQESDEIGTSPTDVDLAEYARAYVRSYLLAVETESPEHVPSFFRNHPYSIEICIMPNSSFCMLFEKSDTASITVGNKDWGYVMGRVMSGVSYIATVYSHEGMTADDASIKGRRDAIRDIRALESSDIADSSRQLEKLIAELRDTAQWSKNPVKMAEYAISRLEPIRQAILRTGPSMDMMATVDAVRRYPPAPVRMTLDGEGLKLIGEVASELEALEKAVGSAEAHSARIVEVESELRQEVKNFKSELDRKMAKGLGVILTTTDRKIDKTIGAFSGFEEEIESIKEAISELEESEPGEYEPDPRIDEFAEKIEGLKSALESLRQTVAESRGGTAEAPAPPNLTEEYEELSENIENVSRRVKRIEDYLVSLSRARRAR
ncbi:MAG: hypothetical protein JSV90_04755 [Methanobacteriota archaeon]|nr:MAG: hypothetical protein JSV90_04755 [Euryarchaeota archaeon]